MSFISKIFNSAWESVTGSDRKTVIPEPKKERAGNVKNAIESLKDGAERLEKRLSEFEKKTEPKRKEILKDLKTSADNIVSGIRRLPEQVSQLASRKYEGSYPEQINGRTSDVSLEVSNTYASVFTEDFSQGDFRDTQEFIPVIKHAPETEAVQGLIDKMKRGEGVDLPLVKDKVIRYGYMADFVMSQINNFRHVAGPLADEVEKSRKEGVSPLDSKGINGAFVESGVRGAVVFAEGATTGLIDKRVLGEAPLSGTILGEFGFETTSFSERLSAKARNAYERFMSRF